MLHALKLSLALVTIPRLFISLLLGPLFVGFIVVIGQFVMLNWHVYQSVKTSDTLAERADRRLRSHWARFILYGDTGPLDTVQLCRWERDSRVPPSDCLFLPTDVVIFTNNPASFDAEPYLKVFHGAAKRLHVCNRCESEITINVDGEKAVTSIRSALAGLVPLLAGTENRDLYDVAISLRKTSERVFALFGVTKLYLPASPKPINISAFKNDLVVVMNICILVVVALWLMLRSHRRVLDYFAQNGALLPLVAANGKRAFYGALWMITSLRVFLFLGSSLPVTVFLMRQLAENSQAGSALLLSSEEMALWLISIVSSLGFLTILGSIGDLRQRSLWFGWAFRYVPLLCCLLGGLLWCLSLPFSPFPFTCLRYVVSLLPIFGFFPSLLSPIFCFDMNILVVHSLLSTIALVVVASRNARWFSAHLDEL